MSLEELYQEVILDHYKNPRGKRVLGTPSAACSLFNPLCGDQVAVSVAVEEALGCADCSERLYDIGFEGHGCSISQAAASIMTELCKGKSVEEVEKMVGLFRQMMRGEKSGEEVKDELGDAIALEGVRKFSARVKCAMLAWEALEKCLAEVKRGAS